MVNFHEWVVQQAKAGREKGEILALLKTRQYPKDAHEFVEEVYSLVNQQSNVAQTRSFKDMLSIFLLLIAVGLAVLYILVT